jgi:AAA ATPase domain
MSSLEVARPELTAALRSRLEGAPVLVVGPPGAGKTTLLLRLVEDLVRDGWLPVYLDLMAATSSPDRLVAAALEALPVEAFGRHLPRATELRRLAGSGREHGKEAVQALFSLWTTLADAGGRPVALMLDEATEIRSLAYFKGLREVHDPFVAALSRRPGGTVLATSFPTLARRLWPGLETLAVGPLGVEPLRSFLAALGRSAEAEGLARLTFGWPRYVRIVVERMADGRAAREAWVAEMTAGNRLEQACRHTYEALLLRSRGYGMSKAVLAAVAREEGLNLTALVARLGRTPGATRDYLQWLVDVDALRTLKKRYYYVDGLVRLWVRLHATGVPARRDDVERAARELLGDAESVPGRGQGAYPDVAPLEGPGEPATAIRRRPDNLMEID